MNNIGGWLSTAITSALKNDGSSFGVREITVVLRRLWFCLCRSISPLLSCYEMYDWKWPLKLVVPKLDDVHCWFMILFSCWRYGSFATLKISIPCSFIHTHCVLLKFSFVPVRGFARLYTWCVSNFEFGLFLLFFYLVFHIWVINFFCYTEWDIMSPRSFGQVVYW